jgi:hypothetical protein
VRRLPLRFRAGGSVRFSLVATAVQEIGAQSRTNIRVGLVANDGRTGMVDRKRVAGSNEQTPPPQSFAGMLHSRKNRRLPLNAGFGSISRNSSRFRALAGTILGTKRPLVPLP